MATLTLSLFCIILLACVLLDLPLLCALLAGLLLFVTYGLYQKKTLRQLAQMAFSGVRTSGGIMFMMALIGMLTALWRACGTIAVIICYASGLIRPSIFILMSFLLNCAVSVLTGSAFATVATIGVICMTMANTMGIAPFWIGGAILAGSFFGDRCSPISTSALLVCTLTKTDLFRNIRRMGKTAALPFLLSCLIYLLAGFSGEHGGSGLDVWALFRSGFSLRAICVLPAALVLLLAIFRQPVRVTLSVSILSALILSLAVQHQSIWQVLRFMVLGYESRAPGLASMVNGGGIVSMLNVIGIIFISSCYAGLFEGTGLLEGLKHVIARASHRISPFGATLCTAVFTAAISCNQTLATMLTHQVCSDLVPAREAFAIDLEDTAIIVAPLIPWSIACSVPLSTLGVSNASILSACFLYLLPLLRLGIALKYKKTETLS